MRVVVPFDTRDPKTRLEDVLDGAERSAFAQAMLRDVLDAIRTAGGEPAVLATADVDVDVPVTVDERSLTPAINDRLGPADVPVAVVMADLALAVPDAVERLLDADGPVVLVPGRGGGTNALLVREPAFHVDFHGASFRDHCRIATEAGIDPTVVDSYRLSTDVDEPADLVEVLLHGEGRAAAWLEDEGFELVVDDGRVDVGRD
ncbi:MAG: 2-phospho-L-lactate guanylyltransferase [Natronomonas sp.]|jgi:2-phospho-L-lactate guanylyltransferase